MGRVRWMPTWRTKRGSATPATAITAHNSACEPSSARTEALGQKTSAISASPYVRWKRCAFTCTGDTRSAPSRNDRTGIVAAETPASAAAPRPAANAGDP